MRSNLQFSLSNKSLNQPAVYSVVRDHMQCFSIQSLIVTGIAVVLICLSCSFLIPVATAADIEMEGYLGDTFSLHGFSYVGDSVYLFMTGPGLPANGVTLTDTSLRADQGHFTVVNVDENQEWSYSWRTSRIQSQIDYGTYIVYVTNKPEDLSHLGETSHYKTLSFFLKDSGVSKVSIEAGHVYTRTTAEPTPTPLPAPSVTITNDTPAVTLPLPATTRMETPVLTAAPTTRAGTGPLDAVTALLCCVVLVSFLKARS
jgi:hypothetical protein